jgi:hypothetical protein
MLKKLRILTDIIKGTLFLPETYLYESVGSLPVMPSLLLHVL